MGERWQPLSLCLMAVPMPMAIPASFRDNTFVDQLFKLSGCVVIADVAFIVMWPELDIWGQIIFSHLEITLLGNITTFIARRVMKAQYQYFNLDKLYFLPLIISTQALPYSYFCDSTLVRTH